MSIAYVDSRVSDDPPEPAGHAGQERLERVQLLREAREGDTRKQPKPEEPMDWSRRSHVECTCTRQVGHVQVTAADPPGVKSWVS